MPAELAEAERGRVHRDEIDRHIAQPPRLQRHEPAESGEDGPGRHPRREVVLPGVEDDGAGQVPADQPPEVAIHVGDLRPAEAPVDHRQRGHVGLQAGPQADAGIPYEDDAAGRLRRGAVELGETADLLGERQLGGVGHHGAHGDGEKQKGHAEVMDRRLHGIYANCGPSAASPG